MTLLFIEGFESGDHNLRWRSSGAGSTVSDVVCRSGTKGLRVTGSATHIWKDLPASSKLVVGAAISSSLVDSQIRACLSLWGDLGATQHLTIGFRGTALEVRRGSNGGTLLASYTYTFLPDTFYYVEVSATIHDTAGRVIVRLNGNPIPVIDFTGDTKNAGTASTIDAIKLENIGGITGRWDDIYVCDGLGSVNNDFLGDVRVLPVVPVAPGASTGLTSSGGANHAAVDEMPYSATDYVAGSSGKDTYTAADLPAGIATVHGVQISAVAKKTDAGAMSLRPILRSGGVDYPGSSVPLNLTDSVVSGVYQVDPATGLPWGVAAVNAMEIGAEVV